MANIEILVTVISSIDTELLGVHGPGKRFAFSKDLVLDRYNAKTPGNGLPQNQQQRLACTHSGFVTTLRVPTVGDRFFSPATDVFALSLDEKTQIQALDRTKPLLPIEFDATENRTPRLPSPRHD